MQDLGLLYTDISLDRYPERIRDWLVIRTGGKSSVPQIFFNDHHIGGNDQLQRLVEDKRRLDEAIRYDSNYM